MSVKYMSMLSHKLLHTLLGKGFVNFLYTPNSGR